MVPYECRKFNLYLSNLNGGRIAAPEKRISTVHKAANYSFETDFYAKMIVSSG